MREARQELAERGPRRTRDIEGDFETVSLPAEAADRVRDLLVEEGVGQVIEVGLAYGSSALAIAEALLTTAGGEAGHILIDPYQDSEFGDVGWELLTTAGLGSVCTLLREPSQLALPELLRGGTAVDAAFVDGSHHFHNVFVDLHYLGQLVRPGGLVILDDWNWPSVSTAANYFIENLGWRRISTEDGHLPASGEDQIRIAALRLPDPPARPSFKDFRAF